MRYKILIKMENDKIFTYLTNSFKKDEKTIEFTDIKGKYRIFPIDRLFEVSNLE